MSILPPNTTTLADLARRANAEHEGVGAALNCGIERAMAAGDLLLEAKAQVKAQLGHGQWLAWFQGNCKMSERTAQLYMRLAKNREVIEANPQRIADLTLNQAAALLAPSIASSSDMARPNRSKGESKSSRRRDRHTHWRPRPGQQKFVTSRRRRSRRDQYVQLQSW